jgi:hypothetical protein
VLDQYPLRRPISFIKIDIEGAEPLALRGAQDLLRADRPLILSELHPEQLAKVSNVQPAEFIAEMQGFGYRCHLFEHGRIGDAITSLEGPVRTVVFRPA